MDIPGDKPLGEILNQGELVFQETEEGKSAICEVTVQIGNRQEVYEIAVHGVDDLGSAMELLDDVKRTYAVALAVLYDIGNSKTETILIAEGYAERRGEGIKHPTVALSEVEEKVVSRENKYRDVNEPKYLNARAAGDILGIVRKVDLIRVPVEEVPGVPLSDTVDLNGKLLRISRDLADKVNQLFVEIQKKEEAEELDATELMDSINSLLKNYDLKNHLHELKEKNEALSTLIEREHNPAKREDLILLHLEVSAVIEYLGLKS